MTRRPASQALPLLAIVVLLGLPPALVPCQDLVVVRRVSGDTFTGALLGLDDKGRLQVRVGAKVLHLDLEDLVEVAASEVPMAPPKGAVLIRLTSGDRVHAIVEGGNYDAVSLAAPATGAFSLYLDFIEAVLKTGEPGTAPRELPPRPAADLDSDELFLEQGSALDRLPGEMERLERSGVVFTSAAGEERLFSFLEDRVSGVRLAGGDPYEEPSGLLCRVLLRDRSVLTGQLLPGPGGEIRLKLTVGPTIGVDRRWIRSLSFKNGAFRYLSDVEVVSFDETPYLEGGPTYGLGRDKGFGRRGRLRIADQTYDKGVGLHARARAVFDLGGRYERFQAMVGVDPFTRDRVVPGSVRLSILADGKVAWESGLLVSGSEAVPVSVKGLGSATRLTLLVDFGDSFQTGARAVFGDAMLLR